VGNLTILPVYEPEIEKHLRKASSMKTRVKTIGPWSVAILSLALANGLRAEPLTDVSKSPANPDTSYQAKAIDGSPARFNKASGLIGMDVRNQSDEFLGHIKDVVFDFNTERVSYAVMARTHKGLPVLNEKLVAVPLSALRASPDEKHLILNADKSKVEAAAGFGRNNWPSVASPSWGAEPFWQTGADKSGTSDKTDKITPTTPAPDKSYNSPTPVTPIKPEEKQ